MRINHNITALNAYRQLSVNNIGVNKSPAVLRHENQPRRG